MIPQLKFYFEQIEEIIFDREDVIEFLNNEGVVTIQETGKEFSIYAYPPQESPFCFEVIGDKCTYIVTKEICSDDNWVFTIYRNDHLDSDDYDYDPNNDNDCRNCPHFYLHLGDFFTCNLDGGEIQDPWNDEESEPCRKRWC